MNRKGMVQCAFRNMAIRPMTENFLTPDTQRFLVRLQIYVGVAGTLSALIGALRVAVELLGTVGDLAETFSPALFNTESLIIGAIFALLGYFLWYANAAIGAKEPPALPVMRLALGALPVALWLASLWGLRAGFAPALVLIALAIGSSALSYSFWQRAEALEIWKVFGQPISRRRAPRQIYLLVSLIALIILVTLGVIYGILSDRIELPPNPPESGVLLYATTFDAFNDEWDLPKGRESAEIIAGELVLKENSGFADTGFYALLESRKFSDFDLWVATRHIDGSEDNAYGVIFRWRNAENYYRFEISSDGYYRLSKTQDGSTESITQWTSADFINTGQTAANSIRIIAKEDDFQFYINDQLAELCTKGENRAPTLNPLTGECVSNDWQDRYRDDAFRQGRIGVLVGTTQTTDLTQPVSIGFDNLVLVGS